MNSSFVFENENGKEILVKCQVNGGYNGIGSYEFWGQRCYDRGSFEIEEIIPTEIWVGEENVTQSEVWQGYIEAHIEANFEKLSENFLEEMADQEAANRADCPEPEPMEDWQERY